VIGQREARTQQPTYDHRGDGEEHEGVLLEKRQDFLLRDLLHFPLGLHGAYVDALPETLHLAGEEEASVDVVQPLFVVLICYLSS